MKTVIIVQARMTSTRLPGKILKEVLGRPLLYYLVERLQRVTLKDEIVIATTINDTDEPVIAFCKKHKIKYFRGSEDDVLSRYYNAAVECGASNIVRITSDCPLIDPDVIDKVIEVFLSHRKEVDYVANTLVRTYPRGLDCEVFSFEVLKEINSFVTEAADREHVTLYIYRHPEKYRLLNVPYSEDQSSHRWTVDTLEDYELICRIFESLYPIKPVFTFPDCLELLKSNPEWVKINQHIKQKAV